MQSSAVVVMADSSTYFAADNDILMTAWQNEHASTGKGIIFATDSLAPRFSVTKGMEDVKDPRTQKEIVPGGVIHFLAVRK